jgi:hypothetical protein
MDVDEKRKITLIHNYTRCQDTGQLFIMNFEGIENPMFVVRFFALVCFVVCRFMVFEVYNSMKMNFCVAFGDGMGLLLQWGWLLNEECRSHWGVWMEARES